MADETRNGDSKVRVVRLLGHRDDAGAWEIRDFLKRSVVESQWIELSTEEDCGAVAKVLSPVAVTCNRCVTAGDGRRSRVAGLPGKVTWPRNIGDIARRIIVAITGVVRWNRRRESRCGERSRANGKGGGGEKFKGHFHDAFSTPLTD